MKKLIGWLLPPDIDEQPAANAAAQAAAASMRKARVERIGRMFVLLNGVMGAASVRRVRGARQS